MPEYTNDTSGMFDVLIGFGRALRQESVAVGSGQVLTFCQGLSRLDPTDLTDLYWAGRTCLVTRNVDLPVYDRVFRWYFLGAESRLGDLFRRSSQLSPEAECAFEIPPPGEESGEEKHEEESVGIVPATTETLRHKRFEDCTPEELE